MIYDACDQGKGRDCINLFRIIYGWLKLQALSDPFQTSSKSPFTDPSTTDGNSSFVFFFHFQSMSNELSLNFYFLRCTALFKAYSTSILICWFLVTQRKFVIWKKKEKKKTQLDLIKVNCGWFRNSDISVTFGIKYLC